MRASPTLIQQAKRDGKTIPLAPYGRPERVTECILVRRISTDRILIFRTSDGQKLTVAGTLKRKERPTPRQKRLYVAPARAYYELREELLAPDTEEG